MNDHSAPTRGEEDRNVIQADIDRAAEYLAALLPEMPGLAERVRANGAGLARFMAAHRLAAIEEAAKVAEEYEGTAANERCDDPQSAAAGDIAQAIRNLGRGA